MSISIEGMRSYIPEQKINIKNILNELDVDQNEALIYEKIYGLKEVPKESTKNFLDFICEPAIELIEQNQIDLNKIKYLVVTHTAKTVSPFGISLPNLVKKKLALKNAVAFGLSITNCAANLLAIEMFNTILQGEKGDVKVLIVCGDITFTPYLQTIPRSTVLGEASTAVLLNKSGTNNKLLATAFTIQGKYAGGSWLMRAQQIEFEKNYNQALCDVINKALKKSNLDFNSIKIIIPHNVNIISWKTCVKSLNIELSKVYLENIPRYGHCFGADNFINLEDVINQGKIQKGDYYMLVTVGLGAIFVASVFQY